MSTKIFKIAAIALASMVGFSSCTEDVDMDQSVAMSNEVDLRSRAVDEAPFFYTDKGTKEYFRVRKDRVMIKAASDENAKALVNRSRSLFKQQPFVMGVWVEASIDAKTTSLEDISKLPGVIDASYGLEYEDGMMQYLTDQIFIRCNAGESPEKLLAEIGLTEHVTAIELNSKYSNIYLITLNVKSEEILRICQQLYETGQCKFATPNFIVKARPQNEFYPHQWALRNIGQYGATPGIDIKAQQAWSITKGNPAIKVAVLDEGVDLTHPDLQANLLPGADFSSSPPGGANGSPYSHNAHGTACAGIIAAIDNAEGVVGVAPNCKIIPIRIAYDANLDGYWEGFTEVKIVNAIRYAWETAGADVLNLSWVAPYSQPIIAALVEAMVLGRGGKGCVIVCGAGDDGGGTVGFPANSHFSILAVGAISYNGQRKSFSTPDGEYWGSNYGNALDVVAPGVRNYSTDIQGSLGLNNTNIDPDYTQYFGGTSGAAAHVSGVAALILSRNPDLMQQQVKDIIERTAQKSILPYTFIDSKSNGMWHNEVGYGLVDAYTALRMTLLPPPLPLLTPVISKELVTRQTGNLVDVVFWVDNPQAGVTYQWENNGQIITTTTVPYVAFLSPFQVGTLRLAPPISITLRCRAVVAGVYSEWSNSVWGSVMSLTPVPYNPNPLF